MVTATEPRQLWVRDGDDLRYRFHPGQRQTWNRQERFVLMLAGSQGGKTTFGPPWLFREIDRCGPGDYLAVSSSFELFKLKMLPVLREFFEHFLGIGTYQAGDRIMTLSGAYAGTRIILRSASAEGGLESATAKAAWIDECGQEEFTVETWEAVNRRLAINQGRVLGTTTPYVENWLKYEWYDRWEHGDPNYAVVSFASTTNPTYPAEEYARLKATMPAWRFALFVEGRFTRPAGVIYDCFDPRIHVVDEFAIPATWPRYVGLDFGGVNHAMVWLAQHPETKACYVYRESMLPDMTTQERASDARRFLANENVVIWSGGAGSEEQFRRDWRAAGVQVLKPLVDGVESGINAVTELFKTQRLFIFASCAGVRDELGSYRRALDERGQPTIEIVNKRAYHRLDALRYIVPWVGTSGPNVRFIS